MHQPVSVLWMEGLRTLNAPTRFRLVDEGFTNVKVFHYNDALIDQTSAVKSTLVFPHTVYDGEQRRFALAACG